MSHTPTLPLIVDSDFTLKTTDTLHESLIKIAKKSPLSLFRLPRAQLKGKAAFKDETPAHTDFDSAHLPYRQDVDDYLRSERAKDHPIILATAAHTSITRKVAEHFDLFDQVVATKSSRNLKGVAKLQSICTEVGEKHAYAGDSSANYASISG